MPHEVGGRGWGILVAISLLVHVALYASLAGVNVALPNDIEWAADLDVEFGVTHELATAPPSPPPHPVTAPLPETAALGSDAPADRADRWAPDASLPDAGLPDAGLPDASLPDASLPDASLPDASLSDADLQGEEPIDTGALEADIVDGAVQSALDAQVDAAEGGSDAQAEGSPLAAPTADRIPAGAHIAFRFNLRALRASRYAASVRRLLGSNADWDAILGGSGVSPVDDIDHILLASPNLQRSRWIIAGRHSMSRDAVNAAVSRLARARGVQAEWSNQGGIQRAPWANQGSTERQISLLSEQHFAISRPEDMPAILALAEARRSESSDTNATGADALVGLEDHVLASAEIDGARRLLRLRARPGMSPEVIPARVQVFLQDMNDTGLRVRGTLWFESAEQAAAARGFWDGQRLRYAGNILVSALGLSGPLMSLRIEHHQDQLRFDTVIPEAPLRILLQQASLSMARRRPPPNATRAPPSSDTPAQNSPVQPGGSSGLRVPTP